MKGDSTISLYSVLACPMRNLFSSFSRVRAIQGLSGLILASLGSLTFGPSVWAFQGTVDSYFRQHPEEWAQWAQYMAESEGAVTATGPSATQLAPTGAGLAFPATNGRLSQIQGYSPQEIQKGLQKLTDRYCYQNPVDCYGQMYYYSAYSTHWLQWLNYYPDSFPGVPTLVPVPGCNAEGMYAYLSDIVVTTPGSLLVFPGRGTDNSDCVDLGKIKVLPSGNGFQKTFQDLTPEQKRQAIRLATPADFIPNPGIFDIPDDGTQVFPGKAPIWFPDPYDRDKLKPVKTPLPTTIASSGGGGTQDPGSTENPSQSGSESSPRSEDITNGPHGPDRPLEDVVSRAIKDGKPQGRWLSSEAAKDAVATLDVDKMVPGTAYSVPIPEGSGVVVRPYNEYPPTDTPASQRYSVDPVDRAIVIRTSTGIHTFPIGSENSAYGQSAPTK
jgi:hypothetical protein